MKPATVATNLNSVSSKYNVELSSYGYVMWVLEHYGMTGIYRGMLSAAACFDGYAATAKKHKEDMPTLLVNASQYVDRVFNNIQDPALGVERLEGMTFPHVLYLLFAAGGQQDSVQQYKPELEEHLRRYPGSLALLPNKFKEAGEEVLSNANIE